MAGNQRGDRSIAAATRSRRQFLATAATIGGVAIAGCTGGEDGGGTTIDEPVGSPLGGPGVTPEGTSWDELPDLAGELTVYSGRREAQIGPILAAIEEHYDDLTLSIRYDDNETHVQAILEEGQQSPADIIYTQDSGTLGALAREDRTLELPEDILETVPGERRDPDGTWTGLSGRVRCVAYNTETWEAQELPTDIFAYAEDSSFEDEMGWRVDSGSYLAWIRAMMIEHGEERTREYLLDMQDAGVQDYEGGSTTPEAVAAGEVTIGFVNQYYVGRLLADRPDEPIDVTFTDGDIGSLFNVSGAGVVDASDDPDLAADFIRHLLAVESQEQFVELNKEYAVIPGVEYVGDLPTLEEVNPPSFDLNELAEIEPAVDLLRDVGIR